MAKEDNRESFPFRTDGVPREAQVSRRLAER